MNMVEEIKKELGEIGVSEVPPDTSELISFKYGGIPYQMTKAQIFAAYNYQQRQFLLSDAKAAFHDYVFGLKEEEEDFIYNNLDTREAVESIEEFERGSGILYVEAKNMLEDFMKSYESQYCNCEISENDAWQMAISAVLKEKKHQKEQEE